ncbi:MAG: hypothetical protein N2663_05415 [Chlorobi bacterium]|nr:hypothetical protein [Chlorobiota bacterium]
MKYVVFVLLVVADVLWFGGCSTVPPAGWLGENINSSADEIAACRWNESLLLLRIEQMEKLLQTDRRADDSWSVPLLARIPPALEWHAGKPAIASLSDGHVLVIFPVNRTPSNVDLAECIFDGQQWSEPRWLDMLNSPNWDSQPALFHDGTVLVFCSDRSGSKDLYVSQRTPAGWSAPLPVGLNTSNDEITPALLRDTTLLFARRRDTNSANFDIYRATPSAPLEWTRAELLPEPINSPANDIAPVVWDSLIIVSSDRQGNFDLYAFRLCGPVLLRTRIYPSVSSERLDGIMTIASALTIETVAIGADGTATFSPRPSEHYIIRYTNNCTQWSNQWSITAPCDPWRTVILELPITLPENNAVWEATLTQVFAPDDYVPATEQHRTALGLLQRYNLAADGIAGAARFDTRIADEVVQHISAVLSCAPSAWVRVGVAASPSRGAIRYTGAPLTIVGSDRTVACVPDVILPPNDVALLRAYAVQRILADALEADRRWVGRVEWVLHTDRDAPPDGVRVKVSVASGSSVP